MGYTHYWRHKENLDEEQFKNVATDLKILIDVFKKAGFKLANGSGEKGTEPIVTKDIISFNGQRECGHPYEDLGIAWASSKASGVETSYSPVSGHWFAGAELDKRSCGGDCSHESFILERATKREKYDKHELLFDFCKTAFKPYDLLVQCALIIAKHYLKDDIIVTSDGTIEQWQDAIKVCEKAFKYGNFFNQTYHIDNEYEDKPHKSVIEAEEKEESRQSILSSLGTKEIARRIREELKDEFPRLKFSVVMEHHNSIIIALMKSDIKIIQKFEDIPKDAFYSYEIDQRYTEDDIRLSQNKKYHQLNEHTLRDDYNPLKWNNGVFLTETGHKILKRVEEIANRYNYDNSDIMTDYFDVNFYLHIHLGKWNKELIEGD
jgi:hypothetical protein